MATDFPRPMGRLPRSSLSGADSPGDFGVRSGEALFVRPTDSALQELAAPSPTPWPTGKIIRDDRPSPSNDAILLD